MANTCESIMLLHLPHAALEMLYVNGADS